MTVWSTRGALNHVDAKSFLTFYAAYVRPKLRCEIQALGPCLKESSKLSGNVQRSTPTLIIGIAKLLYNDSLGELNLSLLSQ